jgi:hypothetical protein
MVWHSGLKVESATYIEPDLLREGALRHEMCCGFWILIVEHASVIVGKAVVQAQAHWLVQYRSKEMSHAKTLHFRGAQQSQIELWWGKVIVPSKRAL